MIVIIDFLFIQMDLNSHSEPPFKSRVLFIKDRPLFLVFFFPLSGDVKGAVLHVLHNFFLNAPRVVNFISGDFLPAVADFVLHFHFH
jgi:hypothetical protein